MLVWGLGDTFKNPGIIEVMVLRFSHKQIEKLCVQIEAEKSLELLNMLFPYIYRKNDSEIADSFPIFPDGVLMFSL